MIPLHHLERDRHLVLLTKFYLNDSEKHYAPLTPETGLTLTCEGIEYILRWSGNNQGEGKIITRLTKKLERGECDEFLEGHWGLATLLIKRGKQHLYLYLASKTPCTWMPLA